MSQSSAAKERSKDILVKRRITIARVVNNKNNACNKSRMNLRFSPWNILFNRKIYQPTQRSKELEVIHDGKDTNITKVFSIAIIVQMSTARLELQHSEPYMRR